MEQPDSSQTIPTPAQAAAESIQAASDSIVREVEKVIIGKHDTIRLALAAVLAGGHILVEDIPGVGKTSMAKALARALGCSFKRIQFTPDLLPSDVTGIPVFDQQSLTFEFRHGPIFANIVLADEINRASPKTQSSLLECMEETQVTADGVTHMLPRPFFVIATQNHIELQGTYPLPEAQLDRFMMCLTMGYPGLREESRILAERLGNNPMQSVEPVIDAERLIALQEGARSIHVDEAIRDWVVEISAATRVRPELFLGVSPRGSLALVLAARAFAAISGRAYATPDDVKAVAGPVLTHRLVLKPETRMRGASPAAIIEEVMDSVACPLNYAKR